VGIPLQHESRNASRSIGDSEEREARLGNGNQIFRSERVFVYAELPCATEINDDVAIADPYDFTDPVVRRHRTVIDQLALGKQTPPRPPVERKNLREQIKAISCRQDRHFLVRRVSGRYIGKPIHIMFSRTGTTDLVTMFHALH